MITRAMTHSLTVLLLALLSASALSTVALAVDQPLSDPVPRLDGLTGASDLLRRPALGAPIPPRFGDAGDRDLLQQQLREKRREERSGDREVRPVHEAPPERQKTDVRSEEPDTRS